MANLVERYVHQVGRYLPTKERAEIQAELRSQIQDQLEDRFQSAPSDDDVAAVLTELGDPRRIAASYGGEQYLVGPDLYPIMMMVLRRGWILVPPIAVAIHVLAALIGQDTRSIIELLLDTAFGALQATAIFTAIVVLIFAILQHSGEDLDEITGGDRVFDPTTLPEVNSPAEIDRAETAFGIAFGTFAILVMIHFLRVGGLTLRLNPTSPEDVLPVPMTWLVVLLITIIIEVALQVIALMRGRWTVLTVLVDMLLDIVGTIALYFVVFEPLHDWLLTEVPALSNIPFFERLPEWGTILIIVLSTLGSVIKMVKMIFHRESTPTYNVKGNGKQSA